MNLKLEKIRARAPLRVSFGGGGTELSPYVERFGGQVLNATINVYAYAFLEHNENNEISFHAVDIDERFVTKLSPRLETDDASNLVIHRAVYNRVVEQFNSGVGIPVSLSTFCEAPVGSGLGSSSTLTVAILKAYDDLMGLALGRYELAKLALQIERHDLKLKGGKQDQYAASFGGFNMLNFYRDDLVEVNPLRIDDWIKKELEISMLLYYTGISRESGDIIEGQTGNIIADDQQTIVNLHKIKTYSTKLKEELILGQLTDFSRLIHESWESKKATSGRITNEVIDRMYEIARKNGALGGKLSGAGGGGFLMLFCDPLQAHEIREALRTEKGYFSPFHFTTEGAQSWRI